MQDRHALFWTGPVFANNVEAVNWSAPTDVVTVGKGVCGQKEGDTKCVSWQSFTALAAGLQSKDGGTKLDALLEQNAPPANASVQWPYTRRIASGFSAGGAFLEGLLVDEPTADQLDCVLGLDCYYFGGEPPGFLGYVDRAVAGEKLMVLTTSGGPDYGFKVPSEQIKPLMAKLQPETVEGSMLDLIFPADAKIKRPVIVQRKGALWHFGWGTTLGHVDHRTTVGPYLLERFISPALAYRAQPPAPEPQDPQEPTIFGFPSDSPWPWLLAGTGMLGALGLAALAWKSWRKS